MSTVFSTVELFGISLVALGYAIMVSSLCIATSIFCYTKIFFTLRHQQHQTQDHVKQPSKTNQLNMARYKKAVSSALWLQFTLVACYLPHAISMTFNIFTEPSSSLLVATCYTYTLVFLNSSLNPLLYCWKIDEVRQAVKDTIRQVLCC